MEYKKELLIEIAEKLYNLGIEVEAARQKLKDLVSNGVPYESASMRIALQDYQDCDARWRRLERNYLELKAEILNIN